MAHKVESTINCSESEAQEIIARAEELRLFTRRERTGVTVSGSSDAVRQFLIERGDAKREVLDAKREEELGSLSPDESDDTSSPTRDMLEVQDTLQDGERED